MTKCCSTCKHLDANHKCNRIEEAMLVMVRVLDQDFADTNGTVRHVHAIIVKDKALNSFCCNEYKANKEEK